MVRMILWRGRIHWQERNERLRPDAEFRRYWGALHSGGVPGRDVETPNDNREAHSCGEFARSRPDLMAQIHGPGVVRVPTIAFPIAWLVGRVPPPPGHDS